MKRYLKLLILGLFLIIDWFFFHDIFEPKTLPEFLTGLVSILVAFLFLLELRGNKKPIQQ